MGRTGVFLAFAVIGWFLGVALFYVFTSLAPWLGQVLPQLLQADWLIAGFIGAIFTVLLVFIWSYTTRGSS